MQRNPFNLYVFVNSPALQNIIRHIMYDGVKHIAQTVTNKIVSRTLPNNPQTSKSPSKKGVNSLKKRIKKNFLGDNDFLQTYPNNEGKPIWSEAEGSTSLPVIVEKKFRGRPSKGRKVNRPDKLSSLSELVSHIRNNTTLKGSPSSSVMRVRKEKANWVWASKQTLNQAMKEFQKRAGNAVYGWHALSELAGSSAMRKSVNSESSNFDNGGSARFSPSVYNDTDDLQLNAYNPNLPSQASSYQQRVIDSQIAGWVSNAFRNEIKFIHRKVKKFLPPDVDLR